MSQKTPKIIQLTTPLDRFKAFDQRLDRVLQGLDALGELYTDLGFREEDVEDLSKKEVDEFKEELSDHSKMILSLLQHPLIQVLSEHRNTAEINGAVTKSLGYPTGVWQHYKGQRYIILQQVKSTDTRLDGVTYQAVDQPLSQIYTISLVNFYKEVSHNQRSIQRFTKIA